MLFNSTIFVLFAAVFFAVLPWLRGRNSRFGFIIAASCLFYGWWDVRYLGLLFASGLVDFVVALGMARAPTWKKPLLAASVLTNLGILFTFKYSVWLLGAAAVPAFATVLPVGISFYTFQSMSYTIDVYRGTLQPTRNPLHFFCYLSMFPQLVAGPIVRASHVLEQLDSPAPVDADRAYAGLERIARGFFKKVVIADSVAPFVNQAFAAGTDLADLGLVYCWVVATAVGVQIYCDFSGYSDIAIGLGRWMGLDFEDNFDHPFTAPTLQGFWRRWHISLSTWFRDYVYLSLGGSRTSENRRWFNVFVTMFLAGVWHGAAWNFAAWGGVLGGMLVLEQRYRMRPSLVRTWVVIWMGWVMFRAESFPQMFAVLGAMFDPRAPGIAPLASVPMVVWVAIAAVVAREAYVGLRERWPVPSLDGPKAQGMLTGALLATCLYYRGEGAAFVYFQF